MSKQLHRQSSKYSHSYNILLLVKYFPPRIKMFDRVGEGFEIRCNWGIRNMVLKLYTEVLQKHLRRRLRTFEENQISKIIRRTKCKMTLLKFHIFTAPKNTRRDTHESRKPFFPNWKQQKTHLSQTETFKKKQKNKGKNRIFRKKFLKKVSGKSHSAENLEQSFMLAKRFILSRN